MNTTITSNGLPVLPQAQSGQSGGSTQDAAAASAKPVTGPANDSVKLTDSARALTQAAQGGSEIDQQKVDKIRQSIADGSYKPNPANIADKLISLNTQLGGK
jgi:negative regulator of flagellin synthesis FlgM